MSGFTPMVVKDGNGSPQNAKVGTDGSGYVSPSHVAVDQYGLEVFGSQGDGAWNGTGSGTVIGILKAIWAKLGSIVIAAGSAVIGKVGLDVAGGAITAAVSSAAENSHVLKGSAGTFISCYATNLHPTQACWLIILNATSAPVDGAVSPLDWCYIPPGATGSIVYPPAQGRAYSSGITAVLTSATTPLAKTTGAVTGLINGGVV
jgi:hypothetical protein